MKDLYLSKTSDSSPIATLRCDMLNNKVSNFTVQEVSLPNGNKVDQVKSGTLVVQRREYGLHSFIAQCTANGITVVSADTNGANPVSLN